MKKTLGDQLVNFYVNYISPTKKQNKIGSKELNVTSLTEDAIGRRKASGFMTKELSPSQLRKIAQQAPLLMKGVRKKCLDGTRAWLDLEILPDRGEAIKADLTLIHDFEKRNNFKYKWALAKINSYIYGDGYLLITFLNDEKTQLWQKPADGAIPWRVELLDAEHINEFNFYPKKSKYFKNLHTMHFHYEDTTQDKDYWIHPDRVIHIPRDPLPHKIFGNSVINLLRNTIKSKINIDIANGEILSWFSHGVYDITVPGIEEEEKDYWLKVANQHPGAWVHKEEVIIKAINPTAIRPEAFYEYVTLNIAAAIIMPTHLLTGIQVGRVTGAEIGFADYYRDVKDIQELEDTPLIETLYKSILENSGRVWKYSLKWNQIYVDELAEAEIMEKRVNAAEKAFNGGFVDQKEARIMFNKGQIELDEAKKIKPKTPPIAPKPDMPAPKMAAKTKVLKGKEADKADADRLGITLDEYYKQKKDIYTYQLDEATKAMIKKRKAIIAHEKALGEEIIKEQEKDV